MAQPLTEMAKDLTLALIKANLITAEDMQQRLVETHASLLQLKAREDGTIGSGADKEEAITGAPAPQEWKKSIKKRSIACLVCGETFKQLSTHHLNQHGFDPRTYRKHFGMPSAQPLSAKEVTAMRRQIVQQIRPWEKAPAYVKAQEPTPTPSRPKGTRKKAAPSSE
jgi:predicted transcriptional regulator